MALSLFFMFAIGGTYNELYISLFYLAIAVCEGALGLRILVLFTRDKGDDILSTKNLPV
ncbi:UNVERIFIED_CONTAM: hypothetical protein GTU68_030572 [Idotea baltica]|nr:hypothetical protein [Idotea baltica]